MFGESFREKFDFLKFTEYMIKKCEAENNLDEAENYRLLLNKMTEDLNQDVFYNDYIRKLNKGQNNNKTL